MYKSNISILISKLVQPFIILLFSCLVLSSCSTKHVLTEFAASDKYRLTWNDDPTSTITIIWDQLKSANPIVHYGKQDQGREYWKYAYKQEATNMLLNYYQMDTYYAKLQNLEPDQNYYFVIKDDIGVSKRFWFCTAPNQPKAFTFIAGGDTKSSGKPLEAGRASNRMVAKLRPLFVIFNGDFTSGDGTNPERWQQWLHDWDSLTTTTDGRKIPIVAVQGNHENGNKSILNKFFAAPFQYEDSTNIYYSISFANKFFHIIALNSEIEEGGNQREWLESDLKAHKDDVFKIAGYHKPFRPHTSRKAENDYQYEQWASLFFSYGLDIAIAGDSHMNKITYPLRPSFEKGSHQGFIRDDEHGTMYIGEGSWGARPRGNDDDKPWTLTSGTFNQIKWIHVYPKQIDIPAHMKIYTVVTAEYDEEENQYFYVDKVEALTEDNLFEIPKNIKLHENSIYGNVVKYPFYLNN